MEPGIIGLSEPFSVLPNIPLSGCHTPNRRKATAGAHGMSGSERRNSTVDGSVEGRGHHLQQDVHVVVVHVEMGDDAAGPLIPG